MESQYRCETCSYDKKPTCPFQKWLNSDRGENEMSVAMRNNVISAVGCLAHSAIAARQQIIHTPECPDCKEDPAWAPDWFCTNIRPDIYQSCINNRKEGKCPRNIPLFDVTNAGYQDGCRYIITKVYSCPCEAVFAIDPDRGRCVHRPQLKQPFDEKGNLNYYRPMPIPDDCPLPKIQINNDAAAKQQANGNAPISAYSYLKSIAESQHKSFYDLVDELVELQKNHLSETITGRKQITPTTVDYLDKAAVLKTLRTWPSSLGTQPMLKRLLIDRIKRGEFDVDIVPARQLEPDPCLKCGILNQCAGNPCGVKTDHSKNEHDAEIAQAAREDERKKVLDEVMSGAYMIWQSPQSFGQKEVIDASYVESIRAATPDPCKRTKPGKKDGV